jgi:hypothetical protein
MDKRVNISYLPNAKYEPWNDRFSTKKYSYILIGGSEIQNENTPVSPHKTSLCNKISTVNEYSSDKIILMKKKDIR